MDGIYGLHSTADYSDKTLMSPENLFTPYDYQTLLSSGTFRDRLPMFGSDALLSATSVVSEAASNTPEFRRRETDGDRQSISLTTLKAKIASHPSYPRLLHAYLDCQEVGSPPEITCLLDEIRQENYVCRRDDVSSSRLGTDPELDEFMEKYCDLLGKYRSDLARPVNDATSFLKNIEMQLSNLCSGVSVRSFSDEGGASTEEDFSGGEIEVQGARETEHRDLKDKLLRKFGNHIGTLKLEFSKQKMKKGKLPREARQTLLAWWDLHNRWPYPTEADKISLAESTGLDQKQINNWFINQRKRHWKPSENMQLSVMDNICGQFYADDE